MSHLKDTAPSPTEADMDKSTSSLASSAPPPPTSAAQQSDNIAHALAGAGGGLLAMTLTYPLITLSTRAQVESKRAETSTVAAIRHIINREGISGLYSGLDSALFGISVTNFVYYYWYEWTRSFFEKAAQKAGRADKKLTTAESMAAGAVAGSMTVLITNPIWVINTRMTTRQKEEDSLPGPSSEKSDKKKKAPSTIGTLTTLLKEEGPATLFAGVLPALVLVINPILQYTIYEELKKALEKRRKITPRDAFLLGALGKLLATTITYPYITVKSRAHVAKSSAAEASTGMTASLKKIVREEGWGGLYKGKSPTPTHTYINPNIPLSFTTTSLFPRVRSRSTAMTNLVSNCQLCIKLLTTPR
jgi:adenine nucleotide transporter 17